MPNVDEPDRKCCREVGRLLAKWTRQPGGHDRGSMSVEAVLLAPVLVLLVLFAVHLGRLASTHLRLVAVADQSARAASLVHPRSMVAVGESFARETATLNELPCESLDVVVDVMRDEDPARVRVTLQCDLSRDGMDLLNPAARTVVVSSVEVIDRWRVDW